KILAQYATLGPYDYVNIVEAANNSVIARVTAEMGSRGTIEPMTMAATTIEDLVKEISTANAMKE
ncbi:MAG: GYD domain-containing protein, partial [Dehalococcoidales bacterium]|nr:GYD domain-containing protein [Dehalococcoidales bacterium]